MPQAVGIPSGRKVWTLVKLYAALKDLPEVLPLIPLLGGTLGLAGYTCYRSYFSNVYETVPSVDMRKDWEKQVSRGQDKPTHSLLKHVSEWTRAEDGSYDVGIWPFHNRAFPREHQIPTHRGPRPGVAAEGPTPTEY